MDKATTNLTSLDQFKKENAKLSRELSESRNELKLLNKNVEDLESQKDEFISMAAHELRAPTTAIKGYISMILDGDAGEMSDKARGYLTDARSTNDRLIRLVNNMINVTMIEKSQLVYQLQGISMVRIAQSVYEEFKFEAERKGLKYTLDVKSNINDHVYVDPDRIREVIENILSNAIKYTDDGYIAVYVKQAKSGTVRVVIEDSGPGISKKEQEKIFNKFYRVKSAVGKTIGTGLGLYISKLIIEKFHGDIGLNSESGKGSKFWFEIPTHKHK